MDIDGTKGYLGLTNNVLYLTNNEEAFKNISTGADLKNNYNDVIQNKLVLISGSIKNLETLALRKNSDENGLIKEGFNLVGGYQFTSSEDMQGHGQIVITNTDKNSLAAICDYLDKVLNSLSSKMF